MGMFKGRDRTAKIDLSDLSIMVALLADLDADTYVSPRTKKIIYQCQDIRKRSKAGEIDWIEVI